MTVYITKLEPKIPAGAFTVSYKDLICTKGIRTTAASKMLENFIPPYSATVYERLEAKGYINVGKVNHDQFGMGIASTNTHFGAVKNPIDPTVSVGGSSGGSAAAVYEGSCRASLGTDTGGSCRQPAAFCSVVGYRPSYGAFPRYGVIGAASSMDTVGIIANNVSDVCRLYNDMIGKDVRDPTSVETPKAIFKPVSLKGVKVGLLKEFESVDMAPEIAADYKQVKEKLKAAGVTFVDVSIPHMKYGEIVYPVIFASEVFSNLTRYDGLRFGHRSTEGKTIEDIYFNSRAEGFGQEVKHRILLGASLLSQKHYKICYEQGLKVRRIIRDEANAAFDQCDVMISPTVPTLPFKLSDMGKKDLSSQDAFVMIAAMVGCPALCIPTHPIGKFKGSLQMMTKAFKDPELFNIAAAVEEMFKVKK